MMFTALDSDAGPRTTETKFAIDGTPSWWDGPELDASWDEYVHSFKAQWLWLVVLYTIPPGLTFYYSIVMSIIYGSWWNTSGGEPYEPKAEDIGTLYNPTFAHLPAILKTHMTLAVPMLVLIIVQIILAYRGVIEQNSGAMLWHRINGFVLIVVIMGCVSLGTLSLGICDVQPKKGAEMFFFVMIGVGIILNGARGISLAQQGYKGLHMQYMAVTVCLIFSPGFNRLATLLIRLFYRLWVPNFSQQCFVASTWNPGYAYTWSFLMGMGYLGLLWVLPCSPANAPLFKLYSFGFLYMLFMAAVMLACLVQVLVIFRPLLVHKLTVGLDCSEEHMEVWRSWAASMRNQTMYDLANSYGLCVADAPQQGFNVAKNQFRVNGK